MMVENTARASGGSYISARFTDILHPVPPDNRTEEEKFYDTIGKLGFKVVG